MRPLPLATRLFLLASISCSVILEFCVRHYDLWHLLWGRMDSLMHFLWGWNIFLIFVLLLRWTPRDALLGVFAWQMLWESIEIVGDIVLPQPAYMLDIFYMDGLKDTVVDMLGALAAWGALTRFPAVKTKRSRLHGWMHAFLLFTLPGIAIGGVVTLVRGESPNMFVVIWLVCAAVAAWFRRSSS